MFYRFTVICEAVSSGIAQTNMFRDELLLCLLCVSTATTGANDNSSMDSEQLPELQQ